MAGRRIVRISFETLEDLLQGEAFPDLLSTAPGDLRIVGPLAYSFGDTSVALLCSSAAWEDDESGPEWSEVPIELNPIPFREVDDD